MIARMIVGVARSLFAIGLLLVTAGIVMLYGAYRLLRAVTVGRAPAPKREAAFAVMQSLVMLVNAIRAAAPAGVDVAQAVTDRLPDVEQFIETWSTPVDEEEVPGASDR